MRFACRGSRARLPADGRRLPQGVRRFRPASTRRIIGRMPTILLPGPDRRLLPCTPRLPVAMPERPPGPFGRRALVFAHRVADPLAADDPSTGGGIDRDTSLALRHDLWRLGFGVVESGVEGAGLDDLRCTIEAARDHPGADVVVGCGTGHLARGDRLTVSDVIDAYEARAEALEPLGARLLIEASRELADCARSPDQYALAYDRLLGQLRQPAILQWPADASDPELGGYWGEADPAAALDLVIGVVGRHASRVDGIALSLPPPGLEQALRRRLPRGVAVYTGNETDFVDALVGDGGTHSDALLAVLGAIAPLASVALAALGAGDVARCRSLLEPTLPLARHLFSPPVAAAAAGLVFLAWLNGLQSAFVMPRGYRSARSLLHLAETFRLAAAAGVLRDPDLACVRMRSLLALHGIDG
jgi:hypothetical protein